MTPDQILKDARQRMQKSVDNYRQELTKLRTGRAHTSLLDHIKVDYYGADVPINQAANVSVADARTLTVQPFEKSMVQPIEKAIMNSDLGLNPATAGEVIRIPLPPLNEERRRDLTRIVGQEAEHARVAIRNIRRDANQHLKDLLKEKEINQDEEHRSEEQIQKATDECIEKIDEIASSKEKELMEI